jgi:hypothetical protein
VRAFPANMSGLDAAGTAVLVVALVSPPLSTLELAFAAEVFVALQPKLPNRYRLEVCASWFADRPPARVLMTWTKGRALPASVLAA